MTARDRLIDAGVQALAGLGAAGVLRAVGTREIARRAGPAVACTSAWSADRSASLRSAVRPQTLSTGTQLVRSWRIGLFEKTSGIG